MENKNAGFTLIELLVVVLIIGILSAVALPKYKRAVDKAKFVSMLPLLADIKQAQELFYLENGKYAKTWDELGFGLPSYFTISGNHAYNFKKGQRLTLYTANGKGEMVGGGLYSPSILFLWQYDHYGSAYDGLLFCASYDDKAEVLCRNLSSGKKKGDYYWVQ